MGVVGTHLTLVEGIEVAFGGEQIGTRSRTTRGGHDLPAPHPVPPLDTFHLHREELIGRPLRLFGQPARRTAAHVGLQCGHVTCCRGIEDFENGGSGKVSHSRPPEIQRDGTALCS